jgi:hypothetical protein
MKASKEYIAQYEMALQMTIEEISFAWQDRQLIAEQLKSFKADHFNSLKGYECYTPDSCVQLSKLQAKVEDSGKMIKELHDQLWKLQKELATLK